MADSPIPPPATLSFLSTPSRYSMLSGDYQVVRKGTDEPIDDPIVWADAQLGVYARFVVLARSDNGGGTVYARSPDGSGALKELVHADIEIRRIPDEEDAR